MGGESLSHEGVWTHSLCGLAALPSTLTLSLGQIEVGAHDP